MSDEGMARGMRVLREQQEHYAADSIAMAMEELAFLRQLAAHYDSARETAEEQYPFDAHDPYQSDHDRLVRSVFIQGCRTGWIDREIFDPAQGPTDRSAS